jgi:hypothetical protein
MATSQNYDTTSGKGFGVRGLMAAFVIIIALSAMERGQQHAFIPRPTARMPAALIP